MRRWPDRLGPYRIDREIGRGGQSVVYLAEDTRLGRRVALKILSGGPVPDARTVRRFTREAETAARLDHPAICTVHEAGVERGVRYIAMRYVEGRTLAAKIAAARQADGDPPDPMEAVAVLEQVARAVHAAHEAGVIHRDIKPGNIMVTPEGEPVVLDFGLARDERGSLSLTLSGSVFGTPAYLAPEQIETRVGCVDRTTDVYALGATLFELLTLHAPYEAPTRQRLYRAVLLEQPPDPRRYSPVVSGDLKAVLDTALAKERQRRYPTALDLAEDLRRVREHEPVRARRAGLLLCLRRWARRNPALAVSLSGLILTLIAGLGTTGWLLKENRATLAETIRLADIRSLPALEQAADDENWAALPQGIPGMQAWLAAAGAVYGRLDNHVTYLESLRAKGRPYPMEESGRAVWVFGSPGLQLEHDELAAFVDRLQALSETIDDVRSRLEDASTLAQRTIEAYWDRWAATIGAIADQERSPQYGGLSLDPQVGLIPIGRDPRSGLLEFAHLQTGEPAVRNTQTGKLTLTAETGLVFVLIPGGAFDMGAEPPSDEKPIGFPNVDPFTSSERPEHPVHRVELGPFFISKYEMTQGQWLRITGENPSSNAPSDMRPDPPGHSLLWPVSRLTWSNADRVLCRLGLALPTEAQWEFAARAGTTTVWWTGNDVESLKGMENVAGDWGAQVAPVGVHPPNPFGLHDVHGNERELVRDVYGPYELSVRPGDGERRVRGGRSHVTRGGTRTTPADQARSAMRGRDVYSGVRPARPVMVGETRAGYRRAASGTGSGRSAGR
jgi:formylglycine-generating enzyme required for sulfatase activity